MFAAPHQRLLRSVKVFLQSVAMRFVSQSATHSTQKRHLAAIRSTSAFQP
jgi:hypothetical protein